MNTSLWPKDYKNVPGEYQRDLDILMGVRDDQDIFIDNTGRLAIGFLAKMKYQASEKAPALKGRTSLRKLGPDELKNFLKVGNEIKFFKNTPDYNIAKRKFNQYIKAHERTVTIANESLQTPENSAAGKIQRSFRNWRDKNRIVLPSQILPELKSKLIPQIIDMGRLGKEESESSFSEKEKVINQMAESIALGLCRIIDFGLSGLKKGEPTKLASFNYTRPVFEENKYVGSEYVEFPFDYVVTLSDDGKGINILFEAHQLGIGTDRVVSAAQELTVPFSLNKGAREAKITEVVLSRVGSKERLSPESTQQEELDIHKEASRLAGHHVAEVPVQMGGAFPSTDDVRKQRWYNSDFLKAYIKGFVPLGLREDSPVRKITSTDKLQIMTGVCKALVPLHREGYVHLDLHPGNVNVEVLPEGSVRGVLADFGRAVRRPEIAGAHGNDRWDNAARKGYPTTFTDCYAAVMVFAESTVNGFGKILEQTSLLSSEDDLVEKTSNLFMNMVLNRLIDYDKDLIDQLKSCRNQQMINVNVDRLLKTPKKWSQEQKAILENLRDIGGLFEFATKMRSSGKTLTKESFLALIDERLKGPLNEKERAVLIEMKKDAIAADAALNLAFRAIGDSKKVSAMILNDGHFQSRLYHDNPDTRKRAVMELEEKTGHLTAEDLVQRLNNLEKELKAFA